MRIDEFKRFLERLNNVQEKEGLAQALINVHYTPFLYCFVANRKEILKRIDILDDQLMHTVVNLIIEECVKCAEKIKSYVEYSIMGYETEIKKAFPSWTKKDFEILYFILFGQLV